MHSKSITKCIQKALLDVVLAIITLSVCWNCKDSKLSVLLLYLVSASPSFKKQSLLPCVLFRASNLFLKIVEYLRASIRYRE